MPPEGRGFESHRLRQNKKSQAFLLGSFCIFTILLWEKDFYGLAAVHFTGEVEKEESVGIRRLFCFMAENANRENLITGTRYMNINGMLPFENMVADYIKETGNHVAYRITPIFEGNNLVCSGVQMEAYSVEDDGDGICFNVYCYNVQPGITINYANGDSSVPSGNTTSSKPSTEQNNNSASSGDMVWIPNSGSK